MNVGGGEAADQLVRMLLSGTEVSVRLGGSALKNLLALTMALAKNNKTISGKVNLGRMLRETRDLRQFPKNTRMSVPPHSGRRRPPVSPSRSGAGRRAVRNRANPSGPRTGQCRSGRQDVRRWPRQKKILGGDETRPLPAPAPLHSAIPNG